MNPELPNHVGYLLSQVEESFADVTFPGWETFRNQSEIFEDDLKTLQRFVSDIGSWKSVRPRAFRLYGAWMLWPHEAFEFFLAAVLWGFLTAPDELGAGVESLVTVVTYIGRDNRYMQQIMKLTSEQRRVLRLVIVYAKSNDVTGTNFEPGMVPE